MFIFRHLTTEKEVIMSPASLIDPNRMLMRSDYRRPFVPKSAMASKLHMMCAEAGIVISVPSFIGFRLVRWVGRGQNRRKEPAPMRQVMMLSMYTDLYNGKMPTLFLRILSLYGWEFRSRLGTMTTPIGSRQSLAVEVATIFLKILPAYGWELSEPLEQTAHREFPVRRKTALRKISLPPQGVPQSLFEL